MKTILIFRTNVQHRKEAIHALNILYNYLQPDERATIDLEDCDKVLRVESSHVNPQEVIAIMNQSGYDCAELEDTIATG